MLLESGRRARRHSAHRAGDDLGPDRSAARRRESGAAARRRGGRTFWSGAIEALSAPAAVGRAPACARRARLPRSRAAFDDPRRGGLPLQARSDPRRRLRRALEVLPRRAPPADGATGSRAGPRRTSSSRSGPTTSTSPPSWRRSSRAAFPPTSRPRRPPRSSRPAAGRSRARRTPSRGGCSSAPPSSSRRSSAGIWRPARRGG